MSTLESTSAEFRINDISGTLPEGHPAVNDLPSVVALADGGYVVVWRYRVRRRCRARWRSATSTHSASTLREPRLGPEILVNSTMVFYNGGSPSAAALSDGGFVVTWDAPMAFSSQVTAAMDVDQLGQRFDRNGNPVGTQFQVNENPSIFDHAPEPTALAGGGFVVTWTADESVPGTGNVPHVYMQRYDAAGAAVGGDTRVTEMNSINADTSALPDGGFAVAWSSDNRIDLYLQRFDSTGAAVGPVVQLNAPGAVPSAGPGDRDAERRGSCGDLGDGLLAHRSRGNRGAAPRQRGCARGGRDAHHRGHRVPAAPSRSDSRRGLRGGLDGSPTVPGPMFLPSNSTEPAPAWASLCWSRIMALDIQTRQSRPARTAVC